MWRTLYCSLLQNGGHFIVHSSNMADMTSCEVCAVYLPEPRSDVYCFTLNFKISKLGDNITIFVDATIATEFGEELITY